MNLSQYTHKHIAAQMIRGSTMDAITVVAVVGIHVTIARHVERISPYILQETTQYLFFLKVLKVKIFHGSIL